MVLNQATKYILEQNIGNDLSKAIKENLDEQTLRLNDIAKKHKFKLNLYKANHDGENEKGGDTAKTLHLSKLSRWVHSSQNLKAPKPLSQLSNPKRSLEMVNTL